MKQGKRLISLALGVALLLSPLGARVGYSFEMSKEEHADVSEVSASDIAYRTEITIHDTSIDGDDDSGTHTIATEYVADDQANGGYTNAIKITTENIVDGIKYVPYSCRIQISGPSAQNEVRFRLVEGTLPSGVVLNSNGEIYGVPQTSGTFAFALEAIFDEDSSKSDRKAFTLTIIENTDMNVYSATDPGYDVVVAVGEKTSNYSYVVEEGKNLVFISSGSSSNFVDLWLDGQKLIKDIDYQLEEGSTVIKIFAETLVKVNANGGNRHTLALEYREGDIMSGELKRVAQNLVIGGEYLYDSYDTGENIILPVELLDGVYDTTSAVHAVKQMTAMMTSEQKESAMGIDKAILFAETAAAKASYCKSEGRDISLNYDTLSNLEKEVTVAGKSVEDVLGKSNVRVSRRLYKTAVFLCDATDISVKISPDVLRSEVDKVRIETPSYALTFKLSDLEPDLMEPLTFVAQEAGDNSMSKEGRFTRMANYADSMGGHTLSTNSGKISVKVTFLKGKTTNSIGVSLPNYGGEKPYETIVSAEGKAISSKYNPATCTMDGKINSSGIYTVKSNEKDFSDISEKSAEMQRAIRYLASKGIINGTSPTTFSPDSSINRAEIATLLVNALGKMDLAAKAAFSDVSPRNWFYAAAASSQQHGLINGYEDNTFRGLTNISKVQIFAVSSRVLTSEMGYRLPENPQGYLSAYSDSVAPWAQPEVALATRENLVVKRMDGTFSGENLMTRGDAAIVIYRLFQRIW